MAAPAGGGPRLDADPGPTLLLAAASGNTFAYLWADQAPAGFDGPAWARRICPRGTGLGIDGLFLLARPEGGCWTLQHWDPDGSATFCSNGTRAALALPGAPGGGVREVRSNGERVELRADGADIGLRLPEGEGFGLLPAELELAQPWTYGWIGNPQLVVEVADVALVDLPRLAPPLRHHPALPAGANVNVLQVTAPGRARIRSWERGVEGETACCGTGCAVAGAWLAQRTGIRGWTLETAGADPVRIEVGAIEDGRWCDLWLTGRVRRLGRFTPERALLEG